MQKNLIVYFNNLHILKEELGFVDNKEPKLRFLERNLFYHGIGKSQPKSKVVDFLRDKGITEIPENYDTATWKIIYEQLNNVRNDYKTKLDSMNSKDKGYIQVSDHIKSLEFVMEALLDYVPDLAVEFTAYIKSDKTARDRR